MSATKGGVVLFDGDLAANFIFYMRADDPRRRFVVLRKALYVTEVMAQFGSAELIHSQDELATLLNQYGIQYWSSKTTYPWNSSLKRFCVTFSGPADSNWSRRWP